MFRFGIRSGSLRLCRFLTYANRPNSGTQRTGTQNTSPETESPKPGSLE
jgi:hypothetical protein